MNRPNFSFILHWKSCAFCWAPLLLAVLSISLTRAIDEQPPRFIKQPSSAGSIVNENYTKIIQCQAFGSPQPNYRWLKDDQFIDDAISPRIPTGVTSPAANLYKIQRVRAEDAGTYRCIASNTVGAIYSQPLELNVAYMDAVESRSYQPITVQRGRAALLELPSIRSFPKPEVSWTTAEGEPLQDIKYAITAEGNLVVLDVNLNDQRQYTAHVTNTHLGSISVIGPMTLRVVGGAESDVTPHIVQAPPTHVDAITGDTVKLVCIINASPLHGVQTEWLKDDVPIQSALVAYAFENTWHRGLSLLSVDTSFAGKYTCRSRSSFAHPSLQVSTHTQLTVLERPTVSQLPQQSPGDLGRVMHVTCSVSGHPQPQVVWYRDTVDLNSLNAEGRYTILANNSLVIRNLKVSDAGMYQCTAINKVGEATTYTWLRVKSALPVMLTPPTNLTVLDGQDATITCRAEGAPPPNITWMFNGKVLEELSASSGAVGRLQVQEDTGDLVITDVTADHSGLYTCTRSNKAGSVSASAFLNIMSRTQISEPPIDTQVILGHVARFSCGVRSAPGVDVRVTWRHQTGSPQVPIEPYSPHSTRRVRVLKDGSLQIGQARAADVGRYTCWVISSGGNVTRSANLRVVELPYPPTNVRAQKVASLHRTVRVKWTAGFDGNSPIKHFIIQSRRVPISSMVSDSSVGLTDTWTTELANVSESFRDVTLTQLTASAAYQFRVSAVNAVGEGATSNPSNTVLLPQEAPSGPPIGLVGSARSFSEIMIQWSPPELHHRNGAVLGYIVRYRLHGYNNAPWTNHNISNEVQRNYLIGELITWKDYDIEVAAYNTRGTGVFTRAITVKTREGVPEAPPTNVRVQSVNSTALRVHWTPPDPQLINGINQGYKLQAWTEESMGEMSEPAVTQTVAPSPFDPLATQTAMLSGLQPYTRYHVTVLCFTSPGDGVASDAVTARTMQDVPGAVGSMQFLNVTDRSVTLVWTQPANTNGLLTGFSVKYDLKEGSSTPITLNTTANVTQVTVNSLKPSTQYEFEVWAWTVVGAGEPRLTTLQSGVEPVLPDAPSRLAVSNIQPFSVVLQFTPGFDGNSSILTWIVEAWTSRNQTWHEIYTVSASTTAASTITVSTLVPFTQYRLRLRANNVVGASVPSEPTRQFQTIQAPPAHGPSNVSVRALSATSLRVGWLPLQQSEWHGVPRGYNISYRLLGLSSDWSNHTSVPLPALHTVAVQDHNSNSYVLDGLEEYAWYEVLMQSYNDVGSSSDSPAVIKRTREAVPSAGPSRVYANASSSTTMVVSWNKIDPVHRNGIVEGYKVFFGHKNAEFQYKLVEGNNTLSTTLTQLRKYTEYRIQVLALTRLGDGTLSAPPVIVRTFDDVPGAPSNVSFPDVSFSYARVIWDEPGEPNAVIASYRVVYHERGRPGTAVTVQLAPQARTHKAMGLVPERTYVFSVTASSRLGWGEAAHAEVFTTNRRHPPQPPSAPQISRSQIVSDRLTFSWTPGTDGYSPLRYYKIQAEEAGGSWHELKHRVDPALTAYTVTGLHPFTTYRFRLQAVNDRGASRWSLPSVLVKTLAAAPGGAVERVKAQSITTTTVRLTWSPLPVNQWNGDALSGAYRVLYRQLSDFPSPLSADMHRTVSDIHEDSIDIEDLVPGTNYEMSVVALNSYGDGPSSSPVQVYVGDVFPTGTPLKVKAVAVSPTEIRVSWQPPLADKQNGDVQGYKIFYLANGQSEDSEQADVVPSHQRSLALLYLDMFTNYTVHVLAFNTAGDGPRSDPVTARTLTGIPGAPGNITFSDITMTSIKISWLPPQRPNGVISGYLVMYETAVPNEDFSKQVKQKVTATYLHVRNLEERVAYTFSVRALTTDYGAAVRANVTTGPQAGSPASPQALLVSGSADAIQLYWQNGAAGKAAVLGYVIEAKLKDGDSWRVVEKTMSGVQADFRVMYSSLLPSSQYRVRVMAYNKYGVSFPTTADRPVSTPSKLFLHYREPFYRSTWFMVCLASALIVTLIIITAILCVKSKSYKYKKKAEAMEETLSMEALSEGFCTERRGNSRRGTLKRSTLGRKSLAGSMAGAMAGAALPPRPAPASVTYNSDTESKYDERHGDLATITSSSVTSDKPTDISSTDSQADDDMDGDDDTQLYYDSGQHSLVGHYSNMNDVCRQSWRRQRPVSSRHLAAVAQQPSSAVGATAATSPAMIEYRNAMSATAPVVRPRERPIRNYANHTDSEQEGSAVMSLNGAEVVVNNRAGSRAPLSSALNAFSSFV